MDIVRTQSLLKCHRGFEGFTLGHVNLQMRPGEILGIMGPEGAGKTTLLRLLWGFIRPTAGTIEVLGMTPHLQQIALRRQAGYVASKAAFYEWMSSRDFLKFVGSFYPAWDDVRANALLADFGIDASSKLVQLSVESKFKLRLAAALAHRPRVLFLDEPMPGQSPVAWLEIHAILKHFAKDENLAVVVASSTCDCLDRLVDTVLMLNRGRVLEYVPSGLSPRNMVFAI